MVSEAPGWEQTIGMYYYLSDSPGVGDRIKQCPEDFVVEEINELGQASVLLLRGQKAPMDPEGSGEFLWVVMEKRDWATVDAVNRVARILKIPTKYVGFAGTKDKTALTAQWISLRGVKWRDLKSIQLKDMAFHTPVYMRGRLRLGHLVANRFTIRIRGVRGTIPNIRRFPNYFAHQRFGSYRFVSHIVGRHILRGEWEDAVRTYLTYVSPYEPPETREARERLQAEWGEWKDALTYFPRRLRPERTILSALARGKSYEASLRSLHPRMFSLFIHAYQSYLFNTILSYRLEHGVREEKGDILLKDVPTALIPGYRAKIAGGVQGEIERSVLEDEEVDLESFRRFKRFGADGGRRKILEMARDFSVRGDTVSFVLEKGSYATALLREIMKPERPDGFVFTLPRDVD
ncbi:MAG: tRNA pseudouridine(13) synthase TruD [Candidatus Diapherotrites archaeon]|nr:tRNA pseudouridine(13) synthase TruD [Candidatus Diapherotrites archaeon]